MPSSVSHPVWPLAPPSASDTALGLGLGAVSLVEAMDASPHDGYWSSPEGTAYAGSQDDDSDCVHNLLRLDLKDQDLFGADAKRGVVGNAVGLFSFSSCSSDPDASSTIASTACAPRTAAVHIKRENMELKLDLGIDEAEPLCPTPGSAFAARRPTYPFDSFGDVRTTAPGRAFDPATPRAHSISLCSPRYRVDAMHAAALGAAALPLPLPLPLPVPVPVPSELSTSSPAPLDSPELATPISAHVALQEHDNDPKPVFLNVFAIKDNAYQSFSEAMQPTPTATPTSLPRDGYFAVLPSRLRAGAPTSNGTTAAVTPPTTTTTAAVTHLSNPFARVHINTLHNHTQPSSLLDPLSTTSSIIHRRHSGTSMSDTPLTNNSSPFLDHHTRPLTAPDHLASHQTNHLATSVAPQATTSTTTTTTTFAKQQQQQHSLPTSALATGPLLNPSQPFATAALSPLQAIQQAHSQQAQQQQQQQQQQHQGIPPSSYPTYSNGAVTATNNNNQGPAYPYSSSYTDDFAPYPTTTAVATSHLVPAANTSAYRQSQYITHSPPVDNAHLYHTSDLDVPYGYRVPHMQLQHTKPPEPILKPGEVPATKPALSYAALIGEALLTSAPPHHLYVSEISESIKSKHAYFRQNPSKIYNGVRHQTSMCKAFVKLPRPFGDQSGGARKWAIRDGCQDWFRGGNYRPPTASGKTKGTTTNGGSPNSTRSKNKELATGRVKDEHDSPVWNHGAGPSSGKPWDPERSIHPYLLEPPPHLQGAIQPVSVPSQHAQQHYGGAAHAQFIQAHHAQQYANYANQQYQSGAWPSSYSQHSPSQHSMSQHSHSPQVSPHAQHQPLHAQSQHPAQHYPHYAQQSHDYMWRNGGSGGGGGGGAVAPAGMGVSSGAAFDPRPRTNTLSTDDDSHTSPEQHEYRLPVAEYPVSGSPSSTSRSGSPHDD